jgi:hypothetical protein
MCSLLSHRHTSTATSHAWPVRGTARARSPSCHCPLATSAAPPTQAPQRAPQGSLTPGRSRHVALSSGAAALAPTNLS